MAVSVIMKASRSGGQRRVQGDVAAARLQDAEQRREPAEPGLHADARPATSGPTPSSRSRLADPVGLPVQLGVRTRSPSYSAATAVRAPRRLRLEALVHAHRAGPGRRCRSSRPAPAAARPRSAPAAPTAGPPGRPPPRAAAPPGSRAAGAPWPRRTARSCNSTPAASPPARASTANVRSNLAALMPRTSVGHAELGARRRAPQCQSRSAQVKLIWNIGDRPASRSASAPPPACRTAGPDARTRLRWPPSPGASSSVNAGSPDRSHADRQRVRPGSRSAAPVPPGPGSRSTVPTTSRSARYSGAATPARPPSA